MRGATINGSNHVDVEQQRKLAVSIKSQDGDTWFFKVAPEKKIQDLFNTYCKNKNFKYREITFIHNGTRIQTTKTLIELGIEDGDEIDAMKNHDGGGNPTTFA